MLGYTNMLLYAWKLNQILCLSYREALALKQFVSHLNLHEIIPGCNQQWQFAAVPGFYLTKFFNRAANDGSSELITPCFPLDLICRDDAFPVKSHWNLESVSHKVSITPTKVLRLSANSLNSVIDISTGWLLTCALCNYETGPMWINLKIHRSVGVCYPKNEENKWRVQFAALLSSSGRSNHASYKTTDLLLLLSTPRPNFHSNPVNLPTDNKSWICQ